MEDCTDFEKINSLATRICKAELKPTGNVGREYCRLLSAVTNQGIVTYEKTAHTLCERLVVLRDDYSVASPVLLQKIRCDALAKGYTIFSCFCPFAPSTRMEHLLIPEAGLGFVSQSRFCEWQSVEPSKVINYTRFTDMEKLHKRKQYLSFNRKAAKELIGAAVDYLRQAKLLHDQLEAQYTDAVDFAKVTEKTEELLKKLAMRY